jgi:hypothetical protein
MLGKYCAQLDRECRLVCARRTLDKAHKLMDLAHEICNGCLERRVDSSVRLEPLDFTGLATWSLELLRTQRSSTRSGSLGLYECSFNGGIRVL